MSATMVSRRRFLGASAALGGGLVVGFRIPFAGEAAAQDTAVAEINAWVVVNPDDTVVIRIARSEMGQGSMTGLAQLVAEELECDWAKVRTEFPTPGQNLARKRVWGNFSTGGSRGIRDSQEYVRKGGATARVMLVQAAADEWKVPVAECVAANSVITPCAVGPPHHVRQGGRRGGEVDAASRRRAQESEGLEDRRQAHRPTRYRGQDDRRARLRHRSQDVRHAERGDPRLSGLRRQGEERRRQGRAREARREEGRARRRLRGRRRGRHVVACEAWRRRARDRMGRRSQRAGLEQGVRRSAEGRSRREGRRGRQRERATRRPRSPPRRSGSRPCIRSRTRTTRRWSR